MLNGKMDPKRKAIEELMAYLDSKDGEELGEVIKPKAAEVEVTKIDGSPEMGAEGEEGEKGEKPEILAVEGEAKPEMSEEELSELIEALQHKVG